jgi:diguanylate cyclase (GGDEF)-like protein/PAS domain S-box-containing protein
MILESRAAKKRVDADFTSLRGRLWLIYLILGVLAIWGYFVLPGESAHTAYFTNVRIGAVLMILVGVRLHRPAHPLPWHLLAFGVLLFVTRDSVEGLYSVVLQRELPFPSPADVLGLAGYPLLISSLLLLNQKRANDRDSGTWLDSAIVATSLGVVAWLFLMDPHLRQPGWSIFQYLVLVGYPLMHVLMLGVLTQLVLSPGSRTYPYYLVIAGVALHLVAGVAHDISAVKEIGGFDGMVQGGALFGFLAFGAAALHPSMGIWPVVRPFIGAGITTRRLLFISAASLVGPAVVGVQVMRGQEINTPVMVASFVTLLFLSVSRMSNLVRMFSSALGQQQEALEKLLVSEERYGLVTRATNDAIWDCDLVTDELTWNDGITTLFGFSPEEAKRGDWWYSRIHAEDRDLVMAGLQSAIDMGDEVWSAEYRFLRADDMYVTVIHRAYVVRNAKDEPVRMLGSIMDITERKRLEEQLAHQAFHDTLTGLPNRALFMDRLSHALARAKSTDCAVAVLFFDLDRFKIVNDSLGHQAGDDLLVEISKRLQTCLRPEDTVARFGGDEFSLLIEDVVDISDAERVAERLSEAIAMPVTIEGQEVYVTASIGIVISDGDRRADELLRDADVAMYRAKDRGKARHEVFQAGMGPIALQQLVLDSDLRRAVERKEFIVYYQPIVEIATNRMKGMEALVRWEHPERGLVSPEEFIPLAEETGLILPIGRWVLEHACRQARTWEAEFAFDPPLVISVNLSGRQFQHPQLVAEVSRTLKRTGLNPGSLMLEITESIAMESIASTLDTLNQLKQLGVLIAIDDFGTGYSSLNYLQRFPLDILKLSKGLADKLDHGTDDSVIVRSVIMLAETLGLNVVAEGVETTEKVLHLRGLQCDYAQGYYFGEPLPADMMDIMLAREHQRRQRARSIGGAAGTGLAAPGERGTHLNTEGSIWAGGG